LVGQVPEVGNPWDIVPAAEIASDGVIQTGRKRRPQRIDLSAAYYLLRHLLHADIQNERIAVVVAPTAK